MLYSFEGETRPDAYTPWEEPFNSPVYSVTAYDSVQT
jgi:hypothetical protein